MSGEPMEGLPGTEGKGMLKQYYLECSNVDMLGEKINLLLLMRYAAIRAALKDGRKCLIKTYPK